MLRRRLATTGLKMILSLARNRNGTDKETDKAPVSETNSHEGPARPLHVVIFTPLGAGGQGGIDRIMDELRGALQKNRFANIEAHFVTTRGPGSILLSPLFFAHAIGRLLLLLLLGRVDVVHINLSAFGSTYRKLILARISENLPTAICVTSS